MFEAATTTAHRDAILRAHAERAAVFANGIAWIRHLLMGKPLRAPAALAH